MSIVACPSTSWGWPVAPAPPGEFGGDARVAWEHGYPKMLAEYYRLCDKALDLDRMCGILAGGGGGRCVDTGLHRVCGGEQERGRGIEGGCGVGADVGRSGGVAGGGRDDGEVEQSFDKHQGVHRDGGSSHLGGTERGGVQDMEQCSKEDDHAGSQCRGGMGSDGHGEVSADCSGNRSDVDRPAVDLRGRGTVGSGGESVQVPGGTTAAPEVRGKHYFKNRSRREREREQRRARGAGDPTVVGSDVGDSETVVGSARTVDTRTGVEIEAAQTLAARRVAENKMKTVEAEVAAKLAEHRLRALSDKERTLVIDRLAAARLEEKINTAKKRSQASFKECGSPIESVGSALSAHEFAFKQQIRQIDAEKKKVAYMEVQLKRYHSYSPDYVNQLVADIPEPYIPTEREMEEEDSDESPFLSYEEMQAEAANYQHG